MPVVDRASQSRGPVREYTESTAIPMNELPEQKADFRRMGDGTPGDWDLICAYDDASAAGLADRVLAHLRLLKEIPCGHQVDQFEHSLQAATRAHRDGRDEAYVVCALLHDIGDVLSPHNHAEFAATLLKPFIGEGLRWMLEKHPIFQGYYYLHTLGRDRYRREQYRGHEYFELAAEFCERYDQCSFDPDYESLPLEFFAPMVRRVLSKPIQRD